MRIKTRKQTGNTKLVTTDSRGVGVFFICVFAGSRKMVLFCEMKVRKCLNSVIFDILVNA